MGHGKKHRGGQHGMLVIHQHGGDIRTCGCWRTALKIFSHPSAQTSVSTRDATISHPSVWTKMSVGEGEQHTEDGCIVRNPPLSPQIR